MNSLIVELQQTSNYVAAWADDIAFVCSSRQELVQAINTAESWCKRMGMQLNKDKSVILAVRVDRRTKQV